MVASNKNIPALRFKGFGNEWESKKLGEIINNKSAKYNPEKDNNSYKCIELEHLSSTTSMLLGYIDSSTSASIKNKFEKGDVLFGKLRPYLRKFILAPFDGVCSSEIWVLKGNGVTNQFLFSIVQTEFFIDLANQSTGSKMPRADWNVVSSSLFSVPSLPEQQKIASFLSAVDEKIQQLTRKKELLEQYKKGVMQQLFSGKLRFKDENGKDYPEWEESELGRICDSIKSGKGKSSENATFPLYGSTGIIGRSKEYSHEGVFILVARVGANAGKINLVEDRFAVSDNTLVISCKDNLSVKYIYFYLSFCNLNKLIFGSGQPLITGGQLKELRLRLPHLNEQKKLSTYLSSIDTKIEMATTQITQTQTFKKGLLQQMFV